MSRRVAQLTVIWLQASRVQDYLDFRVLGLYDLQSPFLGLVKVELPVGGGPSPITSTAQVDVLYI